LKHWDAIRQINTKNYDILLFNEIWKTNSYESLHIEEFKLANIYQRNTTRGGGVAIFIRETIAFEKIESPIVEGTIETTAIKIDNSIIVSLYRPPSGNKRTFSEKLQEWIATKANSDIYIAGDYNINGLNNEKEYLNEIENSTGLDFKISEVTRVTSGTSIDNILTNIQGAHKVTSICIADHQGLASNLKIKIRKEKPKTYKYREMKENNWNMFKHEVNSLVIRGTNVNEKWSNLTYDIHKAIIVSFPEKESKKEYKFIMSNSLKKSKNKKNKLLKQYKMGRIDKEIYVRYNKVYRKLIQTEQEREFNSNMQNAGADGKKNGKY
jgi:hypothetical protein